eukprot:5688038-Pyramimonas_sp.AAC.1
MDCRLPQSQLFAMVKIVVWDVTFVRTRLRALNSWTHSGRTAEAHTHRRHMMNRLSGGTQRNTAEHSGTRTRKRS